MAINFIIKFSFRKLNDISVVEKLWHITVAVQIFEHLLPAEKAKTNRADPDQTGSEEAV